MDKPISHFKRMNTVGIAKPVVQNHRERKHLVRTSSFDVNTGRCISEVQYKTYNNSDELNVYHVQDFSLESMQAAGVKLKPTQLHTSALSREDSAEIAFERIVNDYTQPSNNE